MMNIEAPVLITFSFYIIFLIAISLWHSRQSNHSLEDYILGGRKMGPSVTALSVCASDMSSWLLMALPGAIYLHGIHQSWIGIGLVIGSWLNWLFVAKRLRIFTQAANNALTIPEFLEQRFQDHKGLIRAIAACTILLFFTLYVSSGMYASAVLFEEVFGFSYISALIIGSSIIVLYTFIGGFLAVSWTDFFQGFLMLFALILIPTFFFNSTEFEAKQTHELSASMWSMFSEKDTIIGLISTLAWGLGYFGQPHILTRFMAIKSANDLDTSRKIAMSWMILSLAGAIATGLAGAMYFSDAPLNNPESVFIFLSQAMFSPWVAGLLIAAILSAIMSTIDSQLLVCTSVLTEDFYKKWLRPQATDKELMIIGRCGVLIVALIAAVIALDPKTSILTLVGHAWAGFGAAFGSVILLSLYWKHYTRNGAIGSMLSGTITVITWIQLEGGIFNLYSIVPGFGIALISGVVISILDKKPSSEIEEQFELVAQRTQTA